MKIILDQEAAEYIFDEYQNWENVAKKRWDYSNWKRSPIERENRREAVVYGNCADYLDWLLRNATDEVGTIWWQKLYKPEEAQKL